MKQLFNTEKRSFTCAICEETATAGNQAEATATLEQFSGVDPQIGMQVKQGNCLAIPSREFYSDTPDLGSLDGEIWTTFPLNP